MQRILSLVLALLPSTTTSALPPPLPSQLKDCLVPFQYDSANNHGSFSCALWLTDAIQLQHAQDKDTGGIQRAVQTVCQQVGLSNNHCSVLTRQTVKAAGEEFAWRATPSVPSVEDIGTNGGTKEKALALLVEDIGTKEEALALLAHWLGWGNVAWFFGDSHLRKLLDTMLRLLGIDTLDRHGLGHQLDCLVNPGSAAGAGPRTNAWDITSNSKEAEKECWCPSMFRITKKDGKVRKIGWHDAGLPRKDSMTLVFRYFVVRSSSMSPSDTGSYDRACVFQEGATNMAQKIHTWQKDRAGTVLVDPDAIVFNAGNWESNEIWNAELFGQDVTQRAAALSTAYRGGRGTKKKKKVIFMGPPYYDDAITELCPGQKRGLKTSLKVKQFTRAAMKALLGLEEEKEQKDENQEHQEQNDEKVNVVESLDVSRVTQEGASYQMKFWNRLKWCGGTYEMCANHQPPLMYKLMWKMLTNLSHTGSSNKRRKLDL